MKSGHIGTMKVACSTLITGHPSNAQTVHLRVIHGPHPHREVALLHPQELYLGSVVLRVVDIQHRDSVHDGRLRDERRLELYRPGNGEWRNGETLLIFVARLAYIYSRDINNRHISNSATSVFCC